MENLISTTYFVIGMKTGDCATILQNKLTAIESVVSVKVDSAQSHVIITSTEIFEIETFQEALVNTGYYISVLKPNNLVATPYHSAVDSVRQRHNASGDLEGGQDSILISGPVTDYNEN